MMEITMKAVNTMEEIVVDQMSTLLIAVYVNVQIQFMEEEVLLLKFAMALTLILNVVQHVKSVVSIKVIVILTTNAVVPLSVAKIIVRSLFHQMQIAVQVIYYVPDQFQYYYIKDK